MTKLTEAHASLNGSGAALITDEDNNTFTIAIGNDFFRFISDPKKTLPHGQTVGELNRAWIIEGVNKFLDSQWDRLNDKD